METSLGGQGVCMAPLSIWCGVWAKRCNAAWPPTLRLSVAGSREGSTPRYRGSWHGWRGSVGSSAGGCVA